MKTIENNFKAERKLSFYVFVTKFSPISNVFFPFQIKHEMLSSTDLQAGQKYAKSEIDILNVPASQVFASQHERAMKNISEHFESIVRVCFLPTFSFS